MKWTKHLKQRDRVAIRAAGAAPMSTAAERKKRNCERVKENQQLCVLADSFEQELQWCAGQINCVPSQSLK